MHDELVSLGVLSRELRVTQSWLRAEAEAGRVPCLRAKGRFLFSRAAVETALLERARSGGEVRP